MLTTPVQPELGTRTRGTRVSSPPLKFRTVSFPQYGFKREFDRDLHPPGVTRALTPCRLIRGLSPDLGREQRAVAGLASKRHSPLLTERSRPEVLGSPAGSAVPPGPRLLRPHPRLSAPPADLFFRRRVEPGPRGSPIYSACLFPPCRLPYPGRPDGCLRLFLHRPLWPSPSL
jgi:hypothetical protein